MKLSVLAVALADRPLPQALQFLKERGVQQVEVGCGGYPGKAHCDPAVLLADEATAALDAETARTVTDSILNLNGLTRVVVTHRLEPSALSRYDQIIVMKNGRICEQGGYRELMEAKNQFYALSMLANG